MAHEPEVPPVFKKCGHPKTLENTYIHTKSLTPNCRICRRRSSRRYYLANKERIRNYERTKYQRERSTEGVRR